MDAGQQARIWGALDAFAIELPSWAFANTGSRFGKFLQPAAASTIEEKFADAGTVMQLTGATPTIALHVLWDLPGGVADVRKIRALEQKYGVRAGSINANLFQDQQYKFGSLCNPDPAIRADALAHTLESVAIGRELGSRDMTIWLPDGSSYPGTQSVRRRKAWLQEALAEVHGALGETQRILLEYKPFEPYSYHTDIADWGMSLELCRAAGERAFVLVDLGHHYPSQNVEQIVAWLLDAGRLGGFHFNDRRYADDDLTLGSIDPYQVFRIFHEILSDGSSAAADVAFMIDQSHNLKGKMEAAVQTVASAQELFARAALVDQAQLAELQDECRLVEAEELFRGAFYTDVRPAVQAWRANRGLPENPLAALWASGYVEKIAAERKGHQQSGGSYA